jgi:hypothetical protein
MVKEKKDDEGLNIFSKDIHRLKIIIDRLAFREFE